MTTVTEARRRPKAAPIPPDVLRELQAGKLEQACPCGRWEAAHRYCSACLRPMGPADWYYNGDMARRLGIVGEARATEDARPKAPRHRRTPVKPGPDDTSGTSPQPVPATRSGQHSLAGDKDTPHPGGTARSGSPDAPSLRGGGDPLPGPGASRAGESATLGLM